MSTATEHRVRPSARQAIAQRIAEVANEVGLAEVYAGGYESPTEGKNYYNILLCRARSVDGSIRVYGPTFITLWYETAIRHLPRTEKTTLRSVEQVEEFLRSRFGPQGEAA